MVQLIGFGCRNPVAKGYFTGRRTTFQSHSQEHHFFLPRKSNVMCSSNLFSDQLLFSHKPLGLELMLEYLGSCLGRLGIRRIASKILPNLYTNQLQMQIHHPSQSLKLPCLVHYDFRSWCAVGVVSISQLDLRVIPLRLYFSDESSSSGKRLFSYKRAFVRGFLFFQNGRCFTTNEGKLAKHFGDKLPRDQNLGQRRLLREYISSWQSRRYSASIIQFYFASSPPGFSVLVFLFFFNSNQSSKNALPDSSIPHRTRHQARSDSLRRIPERQPPRRILLPHLRPAERRAPGGCPVLPRPHVRQQRPLPQAPPEESYRAAPLREAQALHLARGQWQCEHFVEVFAVGIFYLPLLVFDSCFYAVILIFSLFLTLLWFKGEGEVDGCGCARLEGGFFLVGKAGYLPWYLVGGEGRGGIGRDI